MKPFLQLVSEKLALLSKQELQNTLIILPNRRAKIYLQKHLSERFEAPFWAPSFMSISDFVFDQLKLQEVKSIELLLQLYEIHRQIEKTNPQSLDQFSSWAEILLADFNDIDLYLAPPDQLFRYLSDVKKIAKWDLDSSRLTSAELDYLKFYEQLEKYYEELKQHLSAQRKAYQGLAFRLLSENIHQLKLGFSKIFVVGFNALSTSESSIIDHLKIHYSAEILWDIDRLYFDDPQHEAGHFFRNQLENIDAKKISIIGDYWKQNAKQIKIVGLEGNTAQVKYAAQQLEKLLQQPDFKEEETALILCNEDLMIPMISAIPAQIKQFNLTMSFPLKLHPAYDLVNLTLNLFTNIDAGATLPIQWKFHHKDFIRFIQHSLIQNVINKNTGNCVSQICQFIRKENLNKIQLDTKADHSLISFSTDLEPIANVLLKADNQVIHYVDILIELFQLIAEHIPDEMDLQFVNHFTNLLKSLKQMLDGVQYIERLSTLKRWIQNTLNQSPVPFSGEPLKGMQVMGMLETRTLDFKNLILLSVNEGIIPNSKSYQSFILFDLRREFNLPLPVDNEAVMSYHFYRLLQRTENITLLYNTKSGDTSGAEASRFIKQIEIEIPAINPKIEISHQQLSFHLQADETIASFQVSKNEKIMKQLIDLFSEQGLSPTSINNYKKCSYLFYLSKIAKLNKDGEVEEEFAYNTQGDIIHSTLENFYKELINQEITPALFISQQKRLDTHFTDLLGSEKYKNLDTNHGINLLTKKVLQHFLKSFIIQESQFIELVGSFRIIGLEQKLSRTLDLEYNQQNLTVKFYGNADRIDQYHSNTRIIDYKTGKMNSSDVEIKIAKGNDNWLNMFEGDLEKAFQLMMYAWMYFPQKAPENQLKIAISSFKKQGQYFTLNLYGEDFVSAEKIEKFESDLKLLIQNILNPSLPFTQRKYDQVCSSCDYKVICKRTKA